MTDIEQGNSKSEAEEPKPNPISMTTFLQETPPTDEYLLVSDALVRDEGDVKYTKINRPPLLLHCSFEICSGPRVYRFSSGGRYLDQNEKITRTYLTYVCSNCGRTTKMFSLAVQPMASSKQSAQCAKFGEIPKFGTPTSNRLLRLFGGDSKNFLKGRQCENHGLGIGAFSYYRRVVENHKDQLFDELIRVSEKIAPDAVSALQMAKGQHQFMNALDSVKDAFPQGLLIDGHNPMTLLHTALSDGLHARTDEECLLAAHDVRVVLAELVERMGQAIKNEADLSTSVARLTKKRNAAAPKPE